MTMKRTEGGQTLVETALILPIFLLLLVSIFDLGHVVWANDQLSNAAREAARYAIVHGGSASNACPVGPPGPDAVIPGASVSCPNPAPSKQSIRDVATSWAQNAGANVTVYVCYWGDETTTQPNVQTCDGSTSNDTADSDPGNDARGEKVSVQVTATVGLAAPAFFGLNNISLSSTSTMLVNH
jgi:TadE-like protein